jgi:hypothetical protein
MSSSVSLSKDFISLHSLGLDILQETWGPRHERKRNELTKYLDTRFHSIKDVDEEDETL